MSARVRFQRTIYSEFLLAFKSHVVTRCLGKLTGQMFMSEQLDRLDLGPIESPRSLVTRALMAHLKLGYL